MSDELKQEIDAFLDEFDTSQPAEPVEETDEEAVETPEETEEKPEEPVEPETEAEPAAEPEEDLDELSSLKKQNELLQQRLNEAYQQKPAQAETPAAEPMKTDFFGEWKFDDIVESQESLQKFLGEFAGKVVTVARESVLKDLPSTVSTMTSQQIEARQHVESFYGEHPQLASVKPFVAQVVSTVAAEHADWELPQVLEEAAKRAYTSLGLKRQVEKAAKKKPAFAPTATGGTRGRDFEAAKSQLEKELEELM